MRTDAMALHDRIRKLTYDDYVLIPDDGQRHEIIDGEHYVSPAPFLPHQDLVTELVTWLRPFAKRNRLGRVLVAPTDVLLSKYDIVQPDVFFISREKESALTASGKRIEGAPDLAIEVLSESTRHLDEDVKLDLYDRAGVREYWIFNSAQRSVRVFRRKMDRLDLVAELSATAGDILTTPLLSGLEIPLTEVFE
ncbi:MAG TPA: Uma2 family endonuclease [Thermoanaerobaculia bacterium]